jgi:hypothetical protein
MGSRADWLDHALVAVAATGRERQEWGEGRRLVRKESSLLTVAAPTLHGRAYASSLVIKIHMGPSPPG